MKARKKFMYIVNEWWSQGENWEVLVHAPLDKYKWRWRELIACVDKRKLITFFKESNFLKHWAVKNLWSVMNVICPRKIKVIYEDLLSSICTPSKTTSYLITCLICIKFARVFFLETFYVQWSRLGIKSLFEGCISYAFSIYYRLFFGAMDFFLWT